MQKERRTNILYGPRPPFFAHGGDPFVLITQPDTTRTESNWGQIGGGDSKCKNELSHSWD